MFYLQGKTDTVQQCGFLPEGTIVAAGAASVALVLV